LEADEVSPKQQDAIETISKKFKTSDDRVEEINEILQLLQDDDDIESDRYT